MKKISLLVATLIAMVSLSFDSFGAGFNLAGKEQGIRVFSAPAPSSPNVTESRKNTMVFLAGGSVQTDRTKDPAAVWEIPDGGMKWWDVVQTEGVNFWLGEVPESGVGTNQYGHNLVASVAGTYPVSKYWMRVSPSTSLITGGFFQVGRNGSNQEITFNQNFVGISFGPNGVLDSSINAGTGIWEQGGDDVVYSNGQLPSTVSYDVWYRFGSRTYVNVSMDNESSLDHVMNLIDNGDFAVKFELIVRGEVSDDIVATKVVTTVAPPPPPPTLTIRRSEVKVGDTVVTINGTSGFKYVLEVSAEAGGPWTEASAPVSSGTDIPIANGEPIKRQFIRAVQK